MEVFVERRHSWMEVFVERRHSWMEVFVVSAVVDMGKGVRQRFG